MDMSGKVAEGSPERSAKDRLPEPCVGIFRPSIPGGDRANGPGPAFAERQRYFAIDAAAALVEPNDGALNQKVRALPGTKLHSIHPVHFVPHDGLQKPRTGSTRLHRSDRNARGCCALRVTNRNREPRAAYHEGCEGCPEPSPLFHILLPSCAPLFAQEVRISGVREMRGDRQKKREVTSAVENPVFVGADAAGRVGLLSFGLKNNQNW